VTELVQRAAVRILVLNARPHALDFPGLIQRGPSIGVPTDRDATVTRELEHMLMKVGYPDAPIPRFAAPSASSRAEAVAIVST
jgi:hypothetical protein